jgi:hypothetical protein
MIMGSAIPVENRAGLGSDEWARTAAAVARHSSIKQVVDWLATHEPPLAPSGMVTQDEYSHDILIAYPGGLWLVYDST